MHSAPPDVLNPSSLVAKVAKTKAKPSINSILKWLLGGIPAAFIC